MFKHELNLQILDIIVPFSTPELIKKRKECNYKSITIVYICFIEEEKDI